MVLTSTHNLYFGAKIREIGIPLHTPVLLHESGVQGGIHNHGHVILMSKPYGYLAGKELVILLFIKIHAMFFLVISFLPGVWFRILNEPQCVKTGLRGFRPDPTQTGLYSHRKMTEISD